MRIPRKVSVGFAFILLTAVVTMAGCAKNLKNTEGFTTSDSAVIEKPMPEVWQAAKEVLREQGFTNEPKSGTIYTRDKRGIFVAFSKTKRNLFLIPSRTKYTIALESLSESSTKVTVDAVRQVYGVTLLTYPDWHDRKNTDRTVSQAILSALTSRLGSGSPA